MHVRALGLSWETPAASGAAAERAHLRVPALQTPPKFHEWLRRCCRFLRVPAVGLGRSRTSDTRQLLSTPCFQFFSARW